MTVGIAKRAVLDEWPLQARGKRVWRKRKVAKEVVRALPAVHRRTARNGCATGRRLPRIEIRGFHLQERHTG